jgi:ribosomal-protein-alanine N-acetyltransferase
MNALLQPDPVLRPMRLVDLERVLAVERSAYSFPWTRGNFVDSLAAGYLAQTLVTTDAGTLIGYYVAMPGVQEMHLLNLTVAPDWQRRGHAQRLLEGLETQCRARQIDRIWLEVRTGNRRARQVYTRHGFAEVGLRRGYYPAGAAGREDAIVMKLTLGGQPAHGLD